MNLTLESNDAELILRKKEERREKGKRTRLPSAIKWTKIQNRTTWRHGFSQCAICQKKLMYCLEMGHTLDEIISILHERHPEIQHIRRYAMNAVRQTTGQGLYDDYILARGFVAC
jgi:hypothetical protein